MGAEHACEREREREWSDGAVEQWTRPWDEAEKKTEKVPPSRRGDGFITFDCFIRYGNQAFAACMLP